MSHHKKSPESDRKRPYRVNVRLNEDEWSLLEKDQALMNWEKATILRESYLERLPMKLTFDKEGEGKFLAEFRRIGNNINQLAKAANSGDLVPYSALQQVSEQLSVLFRFVMRMDGIRQDSKK